MAFLFDYTENWFYEKEKEETIWTILLVKIIFCTKYL